MWYLPRLITVSFFFLLQVYGQEPQIDRLIKSELKMTFPSIYFKHLSLEFAEMPYSVDSCCRYIGSHFEQSLNSLVIWRDSLENEDLTNKRIKKIKPLLRKYLKSKEIEICSMRHEQKISRKTIGLTHDSLKINYLLTLNSVLDFSKTRKTLTTRPSHLYRPKIFCWGCIKSFYHLDRNSRNLRKAARLAKQRNKNLTAG